MKTAYLTICLLFTCFIIDAQNFKFGKVSEEELKEKFNPRDSTADATVLFRNEAIYFKYIQGNGFQQVREVHERIKIYNKEGFEWATKKVKLYNKSNSKSENLTSLKGFTYNIISGKVEKEKLRNEGEFVEVANKYWKYSSFTMPNIKEGCVIEFSYDVVSPYLTIDDIDFQYTIPINQFELKIRMPEYFIYNTLLNPRARYLPNLINSRTTNSLQINSKSRADGIVGGTTFSNDKVDYSENIILASESSIPALKEEKMIDNLNNYRAKLILELRSTKFPNQLMENFSTSWDAVTKTIYKDSDFGAQLSRSNYYKKDLNNVLAGQTDAIGKTYSIFNFVKSKVRWNGFYGFSSDIGVKKAYDDGAGNAADINLMLISMLRYAGIDANPVLVSTKNNGIPLFPTIQGFNYVICLVQTDKFSGLLDATNLYSTLNILPTRTLNWQGRLVRDDGSSDWVNMLPNTISKDNFQLTAEINEDMSVTGKIRNTLDDYYALEHRNTYSNIDQGEFIKYLEKNYDGILINDLEISNVKDLSKPVMLTFSYKSDAIAEGLGDKIIFSPLMFLNKIDNTFLQDKREYPIDFVHPFEKKFLINFKIPEGYKVESMPENQQLQFENGLLDYTYLIEDKANFLQVLITLNCNTTFVNPDKYQYFKEFYGMLKSKQSEQVILKRI